MCTLTDAARVNAVARVRENAICLILVVACVTVHVLVRCAVKIVSLTECGLHSPQFIAREKDLAVFYSCLPCASVPGKLCQGL